MKLATTNPMKNNNKNSSYCQVLPVHIKAQVEPKMNIQSLSTPPIADGKPDEVSYS